MDCEFLETVHAQEKNPTHEMKSWFLLNLWFSDTACSEIPVTIHSPKHVSNGASYLNWPISLKPGWKKNQMPPDLMQRINMNKEGQFDSDKLERQVTSAVTTLPMRAAAMWKSAPQVAR